VTEATTVKPLETIKIEDEMQRSYLDYAMSVIVSRALPDVRDGLKPVHRRILYAMKEGGYTSDKPYKKSARIVGDVMGKYHPHGDSAIYDAMVRMAQDFSMSLMLVDGQGNFGSMDDDPPAAMRYTEARSAKAAEINLIDIDKETVNFVPNYDGSDREPSVLPARYPNLLVNGAGGIAVGMATNIPPHNLGEVIDGCFALMDNPELTPSELMEYIPAPDFPTGGIILGRSGSRAAYNTGNGSIKMRGKTHIEENKTGREAIIVTEIPYQVSKKRLIERMAEVAKEKIIEGISDLRDESDRDGVRIVIEVKKDAVADVVLNQLYKHTPLQTSFGANMLALNSGRPEKMNLKQILAAFIRFREEVITRRTTYELRKARERAHILIGLAVAVANIDRVIAIVRGSKDPVAARETLMAEKWNAGEIAPLIELVNEPSLYDPKTHIYQMTEAQARAILDLRLHRLTGLERDKIADELKDVTAQIAEFLGILGDREKLYEVLRNEMVEVKTKFAVPRRTEISDAEFEVDIEDLIAREDMVITVSHGGYVKRVPLDTYRAQRRGGKGRSGTALKDEDFVSEIFVANTHTALLFFTSRGIVHKMKAYQIPEGTPQGRGKALVNLLPLEKDETISVIMPMPDDENAIDDMNIVFVTSHGTVRRNKLSDFANIRSNGLIAMKLGEDENLIAVRTCMETQDILLATRQGKAIRFPIEAVRIFAGRTSTGVRGIKLAKGDEVIGCSIINHSEASVEERSAYLKAMNCLRRRLNAGEDTAFAAIQKETEVELMEERFYEMQAEEEFILCVASKGYGKRTSTYEYRITGRGGSGILNMELTDKNGEVVACYTVENNHQVMMVTNAGKLIRMPVHGVRMVGRKSQGVTMFKVADGEKVVSVARIVEDEDEDENNVVELPSDDSDNGGDEPETSTDSLDEE